MNEYILNLHMHTRYSDGSGNHADLAAAAHEAGIDVLIVTDHNVLVHGPEGYYEQNGHRVLMLVGEEIHDQARDPQKNHLLAFGHAVELAQYAPDPQVLIHKVRAAGGICFLAHPDDPAAPAFGETDITWEAWEVTGYTGIELWNGLSEFKARLRSRLHAIFYALNFPQVGRSPEPKTLARWDNLLRKGKRVVAVGGSDAHALHASMGPLRRILFPYAWHFRAVNTHILTEAPFNGEYEHDRKLALEALKAGHAFVGYDLPAPTRGFRFTASGEKGEVPMGDEIPLNSGITLKIRLPLPVGCRLIRDGEVIKSWEKGDIFTYVATQPGAYRVEATIPHLGLRRGWIFSNPIYVR
ncbi:MAG: CehA/McbA family metallohydrolase [Anaerolineales bacterium]